MKREKKQKNIPFHLQKVDNPKQYRRLEMIPGTLVWGTFILLFVLSFIKPTWVIYFIILYSLLWLVRIGYFVVYLFISWKKYQEEGETDWLAKAKEQENFSNIYHAIFLPNYKEPIDVIRTTLNAIRASEYPLEKVIVVYGGEERNEAEFQERAAIIAEEYKDVFYKLLIPPVHPGHVPGELQGKSANMNHMAKEFRKYIDEETNIPYENIIIESFDCDTAVHPKYLARISYAYLTHHRPTRASYQPLALYNNNIWESPSFTRVVANSTTFWLMTELSRPEQFMTFSSHSMSFKALVDVGYWDSSIVTEDSRIFLQCFFKYDGEYDLVPTYIPVNMDTVAVDSMWSTIKNQYLQMRRWGWSVEHQPYMLTEFKKHKNIPTFLKLRYIWKFMEGQFSWATAPLLLTIFSRLPLYVASQQQNTSVLVQNAPFVIENVLTLALVGMVLSAIYNIRLLPAKPPEHSYVKYITMVLQWFLLPITLIIFGSIPALDAQTRLMFGKYLGFWNTEKARAKTVSS